MPILPFGLNLWAAGAPGAAHAMLSGPRVPLLRRKPALPLNLSYASMFAVRTGGKNQFPDGDGTAIVHPPSMP